jgi:type II secretory pathway pseudopilin PulG
MWSSGSSRINGCHRCHGSRFDRQGKGFALLEVLISVLVLSGGIVIALGALRSGARLEDVAEKRTRAIHLLEEKMATATLDLSLTAGGSSGSLPPPDDDFKWEISVSPVEGTEGPGGRLMLVHAIVEWPSKPDSRRVEASRYLWVQEAPGEGR